MPILQVMFNYDKELAPASLAGVYIELLMLKECYLRALRALLREIVRFLRYDINLHTFCVHLMQLQVSLSYSTLKFHYNFELMSQSQVCKLKICTYSIKVLAREKCSSLLDSSKSGPTLIDSLEQTWK